MLQADFKLLVAAVIFLCINILILIVYAEVIHFNPPSEDGMDIIFVSRGRKREEIQYKLWEKHFHPDYQLQFFVVHTKNDVIPQDLLQNKIHHFTTEYELEDDLFMHINEIIPSDLRKNNKFIWASDRVVPIQKVMPHFFERNKLGSRFFSGFNADATLLNVKHLFEPTIPVGMIEYAKVARFGSYSAFIAHFLSGRHHVYTNVAQELLLPNPKNKPKTMESRDMFQVAHLDPTHKDQNQLNEILKNIWLTYLSPTQ
jgi:hypothetical protein